MTTPSTASPHTDSAPSEWITRWSHLIKENSSVLDVACGFGRHMQWFQSRNCTVLGVDRSSEAVKFAAQWGQTVLADIENGPWPLMDGTSTPPTQQQFDAVVITNYLWRPLLPLIVDSVKRGGVLLYETFATGNEAFGKPRRPEFLLETGELLRVCKDFKIWGYEDVFLETQARVVQRIAATR
jgi:SAM-dependent methyltransferase